MEKGSAIEYGLNRLQHKKTIASKINIYFIFEFFFRYEADEKFQKYLIYFILSVICTFFSF